MISKILLILVNFTKILVNSQDLPQYSSTCDDGNLNIFIPYAYDTELLKFTSGTCSKGPNEPQNGTNYSFYYDSERKYAILRVNIENCGLNDDLYETPITTRAGTLYTATAEVSLGIYDETSGHELIFYEAKLGAECGFRTTYKVSFDYGSVSSFTQTDCEQYGPDGECIIPSWTQYNFTFVEYTENFEEPVT